MTRSPRHLTLLALSAALTAGVASGAAPAALADDGTRTTSQTKSQAADLAMVSGHGITVDGAPVKLSERTYRVFVKSDVVNPARVREGRLSVLVTLPKGYFDSDHRYPSLYMLHGHPDSALNFQDKLEVDKITADSDAIVITPDAGRNSWYANWVGMPKEQWENFHVNQVIPWIDQNLRTQPTKQHRAVAGFSMGGYGAVHYAFKHPDLFNHVSSYSGGLDMEDQIIRAAVLQTTAPIGPNPFGNPIGPWDYGWKAENPVRQADKLRGVNITLSAGDGRNDPVESGAGNSTNTLAKRLTALGIPHVWDMYGSGVSHGGYTCDGSHAGPVVGGQPSFGCAKYQFSKDLGRIMTSIR